jgi:hypothetical protein
MQKSFSSLQLSSQKNSHYYEAEEMTLPSPHQHLFKPIDECLPGKGHRGGGFGMIVCPPLPEEKQKFEIDYDDIPERYRPDHFLKMRLEC